MDQETLLELARKQLIPYASALAPFVVSRRRGARGFGQMEHAQEQPADPG